MVSLAGIKVVLVVVHVESTSAQPSQHRHPITHCYRTITTQRPPHDSHALGDRLRAELPGGRSEGLVHQIVASTAGAYGACACVFGVVRTVCMCLYTCVCVRCVCGGVYAYHDHIQRGEFNWEESGGGGEGRTMLITRPKQPPGVRDPP